MTVEQADDLKREVREFYNQVGWQRIGDSCFQNARYEDLRPVSREYIRNCHLRVARHLRHEGRFMLDAGSGPIQYPEYLEYSRGFPYRVCADISFVALQEARQRIGDHGLFVVADIARLPFKDDAFEAVVSLHTIQHLPVAEHAEAYRELYRVLAEGSRAVVVNRWARSAWMSLFSPVMWLMKGFIGLYRRVRRIETPGRDQARAALEAAAGRGGTYIYRYNYAWLRRALGGELPFQVFVWRSVSTDFLRTMIQRRLAGRAFLRAIYWLEERFPRLMGRYGQYPMVVLEKGPTA